jgi:hypothetical protein
VTGLANATGAPVPANLRGYVEALGIDGAIHLFCSMGGSEIYIPNSPTGRSKTAREIGPEAVERLARHLGAGYYKIPLARRWVAQTLFARGESLNAIARKVRADVATVRRWNLADERQLKLF